MEPRDGKFWLVAAFAGLLCGCAAFRQPRKPQPPEDSITLEGEGRGQDAARAQQAARQDALRQALELLVSTSAAPGVQASADWSGSLGQAQETFSSKRDGLQVRRQRFTVRYRALASELSRRGLLDPGAIVGRPRLLLDLESSPWSAKAAVILKERLEEAGFAAALSASEHPESEARRLGARVLVLGSVDASPASPLGRLVGRQAGYDLTAEWIPSASTAAAAALPGHIRQNAKAYELSEADAAARAADNAALGACARLRQALADRLEERFRMTVLVLSLGDLGGIRKLLAAIRALPEVDAASLDLVAGADARFRVWTRRASADELALRLKGLSGFHLVVRNVEPPYGWIELDTEDNY